MLDYIKNDVTSVESGYILHGCNCSGGFGSGVAGAIRKKWPEVYEEFKKFPTGINSLGAIQVCEINNSLSVINCFTQLRYGNDGKRYASVEAIESSLRRAFDHIRDTTGNGAEIHSVKIGGERGGLSWDFEVEPIFLKLIREYSLQFKFNILIHYI